MLVDKRLAAVRTAVLAIAVAACGQSAAPHPAPATPSPPGAPPGAEVPSPAVADFSCEPLATLGGSGDSLSVIVTSAPVPPAAVAANAGDEFIRRRAYETLVRVDCRGQVVQGLARAWSRPGEGATRVWLRRDAMFWSGDRVTAANVISAWRSSGDSLVMSFADSIRAADDSVLIVDMPAFDMRRLASPRLVITRPLAGSPWPEGTGSHRIIPETPLRLQSLPTGNSATFLITTATPAAARNLVDAGIDVLLTGDSATAAYAARRMSTGVVPLEWDRTWMLLVPSAGVEPRDTVMLARLRGDLSRDAVRSNARPAVLPEWMNEPPICTGQSIPAPRARIAYHEGDPVARALAERLVAVTASSDSARRLLFGASVSPTVLPLSGPALAEVLRSRSELGYLVSVPFRSARLCNGHSMVPLIDTRWQAVINPRIRRVP